MESVKLHLEIPQKSLHVNKAYNGMDTHSLIPLRKLSTSRLPIMTKLCEQSKTGDKHSHRLRKFYSLHREAYECLWMTNSRENRFASKREWKDAKLMINLHCKIFIEMRS
ncbi:hypothetical protein U1Q18_003948 [Sarracenia purpurea var. burkii]